MADTFISQEGVMNAHDNTLGDFQDDVRLTLERMPISIRKLTTRPGGGNIIAFADVDFGGIMTVHNFKLMKSPEGPWSAPPRSLAKTGRYYPVISIPDELNQRILDLMLTELRSRSHLGTDSAE